MTVSGMDGNRMDIVLWKVWGVELCKKHDWGISVCLWQVSEKGARGCRTPWAISHWVSSAWLPGGPSLCWSAEYALGTLPTAPAYLCECLAASAPPSFLINWKCLTLHKPNKQVASLGGSTSSQRETEWDKLRTEPAWHGPKCNFSTINQIVWKRLWQQ